MAWTQPDIDALKAAIASGQLMVRSSDRMITYRSLQEMQRTLEMMQAEVSDTSSALRIGGGRSKITFHRD